MLLCLCHLCNLGEGPPLAQDVACAIADGDVDPITGKAFEEIRAKPGEGNTEGEGSPRPPVYLDSGLATDDVAAWGHLRGVLRRESSRGFPSDKKYCPARVLLVEFAEERWCRLFPLRNPVLFFRVRHLRARRDPHVGRGRTFLGL